MRLKPASKARLKHLRSLKNEKGRAETGQFLAEGVRIVRDGLQAGLKLCALLVDETATARPALDEIVDRAGEFASVATAQDFAQVSDTVNSQGVAAAFETPKLDAFAALGKPHCTALVLDNLRDPGNVGALIRHAAAFDADAVFLLPGCCDPFNPKAVRASMGGIFSMPVATECAPDALLAKFGGASVWPYALDLTPDASPALSLKYGPKVAFIIGGETEGIGPYWPEAQVIRVCIPQTKRVESLNAAVAASIMLSHRFHTDTGFQSHG